MKFHKLFRQIILAIVFILGWLLTPCHASDSFYEPNKNSEKIESLNQALRTALQKKKIDIQAEDVYPYVPQNITLGKESHNSDSLSEETDHRLKQKYQREAIVRYPVYILGDILTVFGKTEKISGRYNKKNKLGIWIGTQMIPWTDLSPECAAQFTYEKVIRLRSDYVKYKDMIRINDEWVSPRQYIKNQVAGFQKLREEKHLPNIKFYNWLFAVICFIFAGLFFFGKGNDKENNSFFLFYKCLIAALICSLTGYFTSEYFGNRILKQKIDQIVTEMEKSIVDPEPDQPQNYRFYIIKEKNIGH